MRRTSPLFALAALAAATLLAGACSRRSPLAPTRAPQAAAGQITTLDPVLQRVVMTVAVGVDPHTLADSYGATIVQWEPEERMAAILPPPGSTPSQFVQAVSYDERVVTCEEDRYLENAESRQQSFSFDDGLGSEFSYNEQPAAESIGVAAAQAVSIGSGVKVAILDTGIDPTHHAIGRHLFYGYDYIDGDTNPTDVANGVDDDGDGHIDEAYGHGTHVTGIVTLVAPGARIMSVRVLDADGRGSLMAVACGLRWAIVHGAKVINMSLGTLKASDAIQQALDEADEMGCIVVSSAGNWGASQPEEYPARSSHASAVGAVDVARQPAPFTSFGSFVDLSAPGVGVRSTFPGNGYRLWSGTSMSAPFVSGVAAMLVALHPDWQMAEVLARLGSTARPVVGGTYSQRHGLGAGVINAAAALAPDAPPTPLAGGPGESPAPMLRPIR